MRLAVIYFVSAIILSATVASGTMLRNEESADSKPILAYYDDQNDHHPGPMYDQVPSYLGSVIAVPQAGTVCEISLPVNSYVVSAGSITTDLFQTSKVTDYTVLALPSSRQYSWKLQGSTNRSTWVTLDTQTDESFSPDIIIAVTLPVDSPGWYHNYRIKFDDASIDPNNVFILIQLCGSG